MNFVLIYVLTGALKNMFISKLLPVNLYLIAAEIIVVRSTDVQNRI